MKDYSEEEEKENDEIKDGCAGTVWYNSKRIW
jgi:hypothetical protein